MSFDRSRRGSDPRQAAEAAFRAVTRKTPEGPAPDAKPAAKTDTGRTGTGKTLGVKTTVPGVRETVSLRLDRDVLDHFQEDGPGWQERINAALRKAAGL